MREIKVRSFDKSTNMFDYYDLKVGNEVYISSEHDEPQLYLGLKDKNNVEIYEGDVLTNIHLFGVDDEDYCEVVFSGGCFMARYEYQSLDLVEDSRDLEVIVNIHQNPNLIK